MICSAFATILFVWYAYATSVPRDHLVFREASSPTLGVSQEVQLSWAMYSPYFPADVYRPPPPQCKINQVHILQRHGARYPTSGAATRIEAAIAKLKAADSYTDPLLAFVENYTYILGLDDLVPFGASQSSSAGREVFQRYRSLISNEQLPFVRASSSDRVVASAKNWTAGFTAASGFRFKPVLSVILSEAGNDTLDDNMCPSAGDSSPQTSQWLATFAPPMTARLNAGAPGANLTDADTYNLLSLCAFETVATEKRSAFCDVYEELKAEGAFSYNGDLDKYYGTGYGQPLGPVQGVGYINELLARLTSKPVSDHTQTNTTLDSSPDTFPLNRTLYADFSHDNQMVAIFSAMGLFQQREPLDPTKPDPQRTWRVQRIVPFSGRMVVERMECQGTGNEQRVRVLVNDALQPLKFCGADVDGLCTLDAFVKSQAYARSDGAGDFEKCFE
ncbi:phytase [Trametes coccinea BRFM310]|uniref:Phytase A n=1 Tax=Trametes coccinea (strain BRFM310) TaxID=1353009 RepID=A0A1Y2ITD8_TRAC3|nr:phytase [Trametes coccinea BRFM310]